VNGVYGAHASNYTHPTSSDDRPQVAWRLILGLLRSSAFPTRLRTLRVRERYGKLNFLTISGDTISVLQEYKWTRVRGQNLELQTRH
jgi:hypothetical protein